MTLNLDKPSPKHISKQRSFLHVIIPWTPSVYKMHAKLKEEGFQCLLLPTPCWHINEKTRSLVGVDVQEPLNIAKGKDMSVGNQS
jgi:hypothetical protein